MEYFGQHFTDISGYSFDTGFHLASHLIVIGVPEFFGNIIELLANLSFDIGNIHRFSRHLKLFGRGNCDRRNDPERKICDDPGADTCENQDDKDDPDPDHIDTEIVRETARNPAEHPVFGIAVELFAAFGIIK